MLEGAKLLGDMASILGQAKKRRSFGDPAELNLHQFHLQAHKNHCTHTDVPILWPPILRLLIPWYVLRLESWSAGGE